MSADRWADSEVVVVTGGGSGIGEAVARRLAADGAAVALVGRREDRLAAVVEDIEAAGGTALACPGDVRDPDVVSSSHRNIVRTLGPVTGLVNGAAGNFRIDPEQLSTGGWSAVVDIVLNGTWNWTHAVCSAALATKLSASVVSIGTIGAVQGGPLTVHSASAKAGVLAMTRSLAAAWGPRGIRLNVVTPGITEGTPGAAILWETPGALDADLAEVPLRRAARLDEIADAVLFLLGPGSTYITGANLFVDGGRSLGRA